MEGPWKQDSKVGQGQDQEMLNLEVGQREEPPAVGRAKHTKGEACFVEQCLS